MASAIVPAVDSAHQAWLDRVALAESAVPIIGRLYRERDVITHVHGKQLVNQSPIEILKAHKWARRVGERVLRIEDSIAVLRLVDELGLRGISLDLGLILGEAPESGVAEWARERVAALPSWEQDHPTDVVLYGFGRIGRLLARILIGHAGRGLGLRLRAIVVRRGGDNDLEKRASLLRRDSVHGAFEGTIEIDHEASTILANGTLIQVIYSDDPSAVDYTEYGIERAIVVDNTGRWRDEAGLAQHLECPGVDRVVLTAPGKSPLKNVVFGVNHETIAADDRIVTAASCTTNAITPVLKVVNDAYGIEHGHVETVHSYTNDQNLIDNFHKGARRGRAAALNMVLTETGAAKAVSKALPELEGKLTGNAIRVPTPNVSMAILNLTLEQAVERDAVNDLLRRTSLTGALRAQIDFTDSAEVVSSDFVGNNRAGIVDGLATIASGRHLVLYVWYDNEFGYSSQVIRVIEHMADQKAKARQLEPA
ncbi:glyceraldehyde-3-phosphate dehydrogenase [Agrococcus sp. HG114]|uniref:glyceraldehyde-3-phosphate dehydrogenase n=1 Tax=Agrococcus sp. HG114 TaxID=2969757 RepID=UPI00215A4935|nr:glyceraldehyde-3-phosphate dehydrogenase [Agrococcus sp. HG114]MCR8669883.1 glyceraldehyde-3-phosphate dehydrogenase [Agrococcus sp. HG114]